MQNHNQFVALSIVSH